MPLFVLPPRLCWLWSSFCRVLRPRRACTLRQVRPVWWRTIQPWPEKPTVARVATARCHDDAENCFNEGSLPAGPSNAGRAALRTFGWIQSKTHSSWAHFRLDVRSCSRRLGEPAPNLGCRIGAYCAEARLPKTMNQRSWFHPGTAFSETSAAIFYWPSSTWCGALTWQSSVH